MTKRIISKLILLFSLIPSFFYSQDIETNEYGLNIVSELNTYMLLTENDSSKILIDLEEYIPEIVLDIRYASDNNFLGEPVYNLRKAFARLSVAKALKSIQDELKEKNLGLKIFDAYRPFSVTVKFYEKVMDTVFVASPWHGSKHNRGCAVDLTLIDLNTGNELEMPTEYDDFTEKAAHDYMELTPDVIANRNLLKEIMIKYGFVVYPAEWWHYDFVGWEIYELMDLSFEDLIN